MWERTGHLQLMSKVSAPAVSNHRKLETSLTDDWKMKGHLQLDRAGVHQHTATRAHTPKGCAQRMRVYAHTSGYQTEGGMMLKKSELKKLTHAINQLSASVQILTTEIARRPIELREVPQDTEIGKA